MFRMGLLQGVIFALLAFIIAEKGSDLEDSLLEALGQEIDSEDCSLLNDGPSCQASAFLQTGASLRWSESSLRADQVEQDDPSGAALSFLQQEMSAEAAVGEVHRSSSAEEVAEVRGQKVGEVHVDRSQELLRQWQEERMEMYSSQSAPSVSAIASEATEALQSLRAHPSRGLAGFSLLWVLLLVLIVVTTGALLLLWGPRKLSLEEHQGPQWLPEPLSQDLVSCEAQTRKLVEEGLPQPSSVPQPEPQEQLKQQKLQERLRQLLREAVVCAEANLEELLPSAAGYDCALSKPVSSGRPVKLLCRIEGPLPGGPPPLGLLRAPLSQRSCVCFTAVAEGPAPKKAEECVDFQVSLVGAPWVRIDVQGHELKLLDTESASTPDQAFGDLPRHWKSFVSPERDSKALFGLPSQPPASVLEGRFRFREDVLQVGSEVGLCGELIRDSSGRIFLQPWQQTACTEASDSWRTSWELDGCADLERPRVLATTDAALMEEAPEPQVPSAESCFEDFNVMLP